MSFFPPEPPPPEPAERPEREPDPPWLAPPAGELPHVLPVSAVLAASHYVAVLLRSAQVYSNGMEFQIQARLRRDNATDGQWEDLQSRFNSYGRSGRHNPGRFRIGVLLADGSQAINASRAPTPGKDLDTPHLTRQGGGGTGSDTFHDIDWTFWLWPLPPDGPIELIVDWPVLNLQEQRTTLDGSTLSTSSGAATQIWTEPITTPSSSQPSWTIQFQPPPAVS